MAHRKYSRYYFCIGSDWHDHITDIDAYTKAEAMKKARAMKVRPTDHCNLINEVILWRAK